MSDSKSRSEFEEERKRVLDRYVNLLAFTVQELVRAQEQQGLTIRCLSYHATFAFALQA